MKKIISIIIITLFSINAAYSQDSVYLDKAMQEIAGYLETRLPAKTVVAVLNVKSDSRALSSHIIGELVNTILARGNLIPIDREHIDFIQKELQLHLSGDVSDETAQAIGKLLGAQTIISGEVIMINNQLSQTTMFRLAIKAISVETAAIQGTVSKNIRIDKKIRTLTGGAEGFPVSIGGGARLGGSFMTGTREEQGKETITRDASRYNCDFTVTETKSKSAFDMGGFMFLDLKYTEINAGFYHSRGKSGWSWNKDYFYNDYFTNTKMLTENKKGDGAFSAWLINIGVLGKYPFYPNANITLFPALGADYQFWAQYTENRENVRGDLSANNALWFKAGGGIDCKISDRFFLRGELLWAVKLPSKNERGDPFKYFTHSPSAYIGIGYFLTGNTRGY